YAGPALRHSLRALASARSSASQTRWLTHAGLSAPSMAQTVPPGRTRPADPHVCGHLPVPVIVGSAVAVDGVAEFARGGGGGFGVVVAGRGVEDRARGTDHQPGAV